MTPLAATGQTKDAGATDLAVPRPTGPRRARSARPQQPAFQLPEPAVVAAEKSAKAAVRAAAEKAAEAAGKAAGDPEPVEGLATPPPLQPSDRPAPLTGQPFLPTAPAMEGAIPDVPRHPVATAADATQAPPPSGEAARQSLSAEARADTSPAATPDAPRPAAPPPPLLQMLLLAATAKPQQLPAPDKQAASAPAASLTPPGARAQTSTPSAPSSLSLAMRAAATPKTPDAPELPTEKGGGSRAGNKPTALGLQPAPSTLPQAAPFQLEPPPAQMDTAPAPATIAEPKLPDALPEPAADVVIELGRDQQLDVTIAAATPESRDRLEAARGELRQDLAAIGADVDAIRVELRNDADPDTSRSDQGPDPGDERTPQRDARAEAPADPRGPLNRQPSATEGPISATARIDRYA